MKINQLGTDKELYLFDLDNVLFPRRDYMVQVYYLFASFYEFTEGTVLANDMARFMTKVHDIHGEGQVYLATKAMYNLDDKYWENFERLKANAQLPLKLELFPQIKDFLLDINQVGRKIAILTKGNPVEQLNKMKFLDWEELNFLKDTIKVYFYDELKFRKLNPITFIAEEYRLDFQSIAYITHYNYEANEIKVE